MEFEQEVPLISEKNLASDSLDISITNLKKPHWLRKLVGRFGRYWILGPIEIDGIIKYTDKAQEELAEHESTSINGNKEESQNNYKKGLLNNFYRLYGLSVKDLSWEELLKTIAQWKIEAKPSGYVKTGRFYIGSILAAIIPTAAGYVVGNGIASAIYSWVFVGIAATSIIAPIWVGVIGGIILMTLLGIGVYQYYKSVNEIETRHNITSQQLLEKMYVDLSELKKKFLSNEDIKVEKLPKTPVTKKLNPREKKDELLTSPIEYLTDSVILEEADGGKGFIGNQENVFIPLELFNKVLTKLEVLQKTVEELKSERKNN